MTTREDLDDETVTLSRNRPRIVAEQGDVRDFERMKPVTQGVSELRRLDFVLANAILPQSAKSATTSQPMLDPVDVLLRRCLLHD